MAVGLSRLGARTGMISCLGEDSLSSYLIDFLQSEKVETGHVQSARGYLPPLCLTEVSPSDRFPQVFYRHDAVDIMLDATDDDLDGSDAKSTLDGGRSRLPSGSNVYPDCAASTARQISGIVAVAPPSLPILN